MERRDIIVWLKTGAEDATMRDIILAARRNAAERDWLNKEAVFSLCFDSFLFVPWPCVCCECVRVRTCMCSHSPVRTWNLGRSWWRAAQCWSGPGRQMSSSERHPQREAPSHWRWAATQQRVGGGKHNCQSQHINSQVTFLIFFYLVGVSLHPITSRCTIACFKLSVSLTNSLINWDKIGWMFCNHYQQRTESDVNCLFWCATEASRIYLFTQFVPSGCLHALHRSRTDTESVCL